MVSQALYGPAARGFLLAGGMARWALVAGAVGFGCSSAPVGGEAPLVAGLAAPGGQPRGGFDGGAVRTGDGGRAPAIVGNTPITWEQMRPLMAEAAGGLVLEEIVLDRALEAELGRRDVVVTAEDVAREREMLVRSLARVAESTPDAAADLLATLRRSRGLGEQRFAALLRRNAGLRRLVRTEVQITDADLRTGYEVQFGAKHRARLIVVSNERAAAQALARVHGGPDRPAEPFGEVAAELSTDSSAARGGVIEPISPADPVYPAGLRQALARLSVGEVSDPIALEQGFAILRLEEIVPASARAFEAVRGEVEAELRMIRERAAMDALAARLLASSPVMVMDRSLDWSWQGRRDQNPR